MPYTDHARLESYRTRAELCAWRDDAVLPTIVLLLKAHNRLVNIVDHLDRHGPPAPQAGTWNTKTIRRIIDRWCERNDLDTQAHGGRRDYRLFVQAYEGIRQ